MAVSQKGATYLHRNDLRDEYVRKALDDVWSRVQAIANQGQFGLNGKINPPTAPSAISVVAANGIFTAQITHNNPPSGTRWRLQWSTNPSFPSGSTIEEELAAPNWQKSLPNQKLYFRAAAKFLASEATAWLYFGSAAAPTQVYG